MTIHGNHGASADGPEDRDGVDGPVSAPAAPRVLLVGGDRAMGERLARKLSRRHLEARWLRRGEESLALLDREDLDVVVADLNLEGMSGIDLCRHLSDARPNIPVILITASGNLDSAVAAIRAGAFDFVAKPFELEELILSLRRALGHRHLREEVTRLRARAHAPTETLAATHQAHEDIVGRSRAMQQVWTLVDRVAPTDASVLISGESGTGKELVARALHRRGPRADRPFMALSCAAMPETLLESELFGYKRGAFTDAKISREGLLVRATGGTLFLDEIGELPLSLQPKLLRALEERTARPVGGDAEIPFDVRLLAATNVDLDAAVAQGRFREDLFYRINVVQITVPPLRDRGQDVLLLAQHFVERFAALMDRPVEGIDPAAAQSLLAYRWPGNVRELRNCIERAVALAGDPLVTLDYLPMRVRTTEPRLLVVAGADASELLPMREIERRYVLQVLDAVEGNRTRAATILGFDRKTLYRKLIAYGLPGDEGPGQKTT